jgi:23S rRNA (uracil1939-C5)-methyltransferase
MSCDPATLARDCKELAIDGYTIKRAEVLDMFPQTGHVETLVQLVK